MVIVEVWDVECAISLAGVQANLAEALHRAAFLWQWFKWQRTILWVDFLR